MSANQPEAPSWRVDSTHAGFGRLLAGIVATWLVIFAYSQVWIWQGVDLTDEGYNLTNHYLMSIDSPAYTYELRWLSDLAGAAWLRATGDPGVLGARVGGVVVFATSGAVAFILLFPFFGARRSALAAIGTAIALDCHGTILIDYNTFPVLLLLCGAAAIMSAERSKTHLGVLHAAAAGAFLGLGVMARFPLVLALGLPLVPFGVGWALRRRPRAHSLVLAAVSLFSAGCVMGACLAALSVRGRLDQYWASIFGGTYDNLSNSHGFLRLVRKYGADAISVAEVTLFVLVVLVLLAFLARRLALRLRIERTALPVFVLAVTAAGMTGTVFFGPAEVIINKLVLLLPGLGLVAAVLCVVTECRREPERRSVELVSLLALAASIPVLSMLGSGTGLRAMRWGSWLLLSAGFLGLGDAARRLPGEDRLTRLDVEAARRWMVAGAIGMLIFVVVARFVNPYRDLRNRFALVSELQHPRLSHIYTSHSRQESVDALLRQIERRTRPGDELLAYNGAPMLYYLTRTKPALRFSWVVGLSEGSLRKRLDLLEGRGTLPEVAVRVTTDTATSNWGSGAPASECGPPQAKLIDARLREWGYHEAWSNDDFMLLTRSPSSRIIPSAARGSPRRTPGT